LAKKKSSAEKRHRQSEERRMRNKAAKSAVRTSVKKFITLVQKKDPESEAALREMVKKIDTRRGKALLKRTPRRAKNQGCSGSTIVIPPRRRNRIPSARR